MSGTTISGTYGVGITLTSAATQNPVTVLSSGLIDAASGSGIYGTDVAAWTIYNDGTVIAPSRGVFLTAGGTIDNAVAGLIRGARGIEVKGSTGVVINAGSIGGTSAEGIKFDAAGSVTNLASGTVSSIDIALAGTVSNAGVIDLGVGLLAGGQVTNSGSIGGGGYAVQAVGPLDVTNLQAGVLTGVIGVDVTSGAATVSNAGMITGTGVGLALLGGGTVINTGTIGGNVGNPSRGGISLGAGAIVSNAASGVISGTLFGIYLTGGDVVTNAGTIDGPNFAVGFAEGATYDPHTTVINTGWIGGPVGVGYVTNAAGGYITDVVGFNRQLVNAGTIAFTYFNRYLGNVTNVSGGSIGRVTFAFGDAVTNLSGGTLGYIYVEDTGTVFNAAGGIVTNIDVNNFYSFGLGGFVYNDGLIREGVVRATTLVNSGTIEGGSSGGRVVADPGAQFGGIEGYSVGPGTTTTMELAVGNGGRGTLPGFGTSITNFDSIAFDSGATWTIAGKPSGLGGVISGFAQGDTIDLSNLSETVSSYSGGFLTLTGDQTVTLHLPGTFTTASFTTAPDDGVGTDISLVICFTPGTLIATPAGEVPVERLVVGDEVSTQRGDAKRIVWIGEGRVLATRGRRTAATPVIVRKGALADNVPHHDLRLTKAHSLYVDGMLIPVEFLINHRSILWDDRAQEVGLFHIELESHDVLLANGTPAESYRDDGNRWLFRNANRAWGLRPQRPCAAVITGGPIVDAAWRRFLDRSGPRLGLPMTNDPDLHLLVDGQRIDAALRHGEWLTFNLTSRPKTVRIVSRSSVPQELGLARDPRSLGVGLRQITVRQRTRYRTIEADDAALVEGFHAFEPDLAMRWTDGDATVPTRLFDGFIDPMELVLCLGGVSNYVEHSGVEGPSVRKRTERNVNADGIWRIPA